MAHTQLVVACMAGARGFHTAWPGRLYIVSYGSLFWEAGRRMPLACTCVCVKWGVLKFLKA